MDSYGHGNSEYTVSVKSCYSLAHSQCIVRATLRNDIRGLRKQTILQTTSLVERRTSLLKKVQQFREIQRQHMPGFDPKDYAPSDSPTSTDVEHFKLYLPSSLSASHRRKYCPASLSEIEDRLRFAEATDALESLRHHLRCRSFTNRFKVTNVTGQVRNTCARECQTRIDEKVKASEPQYRRARQALLELQGHGDWEDVLRVLNQSDV